MGYVNCNNLLHFSNLLCHCFPCLISVEIDDIDLRTTSEHGYITLPPACILLYTRGHLLPHFVNCSSLKYVGLSQRHEISLLPKLFHKTLRPTILNVYFSDERDDEILKLIENNDEMLSQLDVLRRLFRFNNQFFKMEFCDSDLYLSPFRNQNFC